MPGGASGSNILRGGKRTYSCNTLVGNYVEEAYRPNAPKLNWPGGDGYETNTQHQQRESASLVVQQFGKGLGIEKDPRYDYTRIIAPDKARDASTWISLSHSAHANTSKPTEFAAPREMKAKGLQHAEKIEAHRKRWTSESEELKRVRYVTENSAMQDPSVNPRFRKPMHR